MFFQENVSPLLIMPLSIGWPRLNIYLKLAHKIASGRIKNDVFGAICVDGLFTLALNTE